MSQANVGLLVVVSHPLKLTALAVAAVVAFVALVALVAVAAFHEIFIPHVPLAPPPTFVGASLATCARTKAVEASCVVFVFTAAVGAVGVPERAGEARVA